MLPVTAPAIPNGAVEICRGRIVQVGRWSDFKGKPGRSVLDLGETVLLPGLVNAHCHLDYTHMAGHFSPPKIFTDWLKLITEAKSGWDLSDYRKSWLEGAGMLVASGTTTVADMEAVPQLLPQAWNHTPLRVVSFLEMIGITGRRAPEAVLQEALDTAKRLRHSRCRVGLSPHAPYSTVPELMRFAAREARRRRWPICTHVAESALEVEMFAHGSGEMHQWIARSGRDMSDCGLGSPVQHLGRCGLLGRNLIATHANYLCRGDAGRLARAGAHVVHCPRSFTYFRHHGFPLRRLLRAGVNVALGTDSLASVCQTRRHPAKLSLRDEMRALAHREPWLNPRRIVEMATINGAHALGMSGLIGEIRAGAFADVAAFPFGGGPRSACESIVHESGPPRCSMIGGRWAIAPEKRDS